MTHSLRSFTRFLIRALGLLLLSASLQTLTQSPTTPYVSTTGTAAGGGTYRFGAGAS